MEKHAQSLFLKYALVIGLITILILISEYSFLLFHVLVEISSIAVAFSIFLLTWISKEKLKNSFLMVMGLGSLSVALFDLFHTLAYKDMNIFIGFDSDLPTQFWIIARFYQACIFIFGVLLFRYNISLPVKTQNLVHFGSFIVIICSLFVWHVFPPCFIEGSGLTPFKINMEYIIITIFALGTLLAYSIKSQFTKEIFNDLWVFGLLMCVAEFLFTKYADVFDLSNILGHFFKVFAYIFLFRAIVASGIRDPLNSIYRNLVENEKLLLKEKRLFQIVSEKTVDMEYWRDAEKYIYVSPSCETVTGYGSEEFYSQPDLMESIIDPEFSEIWLNHQIHENKHQNTIIELKIITKTGESRWIEHLCHPIFEDGIALGIRASNRDITRRKETELEMKKLQQFLPICANCKKVRDDEGYWQQVEVYIAENYDTIFSHSLCPDCLKKLYPEYL